ncbi:transposase [Streptomyces sp. MP131-18]|uniref:transposase n=1 Tax=Streptomyces sp. MP131-18 TaxID=1857892 RepID=UPI00097BF730|nr:transposase [Streptomyces sp. MP131-18]ONK10883.1 Transposase IS116/IS110/IS902 family protein [Streptomyces sp. MP131-18]
MLGAEFPAATSSDMAGFGTADRLVGFAGLAPAPRDSGRISGDMHRPARYHRGLRHAFSTPALISIKGCEEFRRFCDRERAEGNGPFKPSSRWLVDGSMPGGPCCVMDGAANAHRT